MKDYSKLYEITNPASKLLTQIFADVFEKGYELCREDGIKEKPSLIYEQYEKGMNAAWECAKKIAFCNQGELCEIFPEDDFDDNDLGWLDKYTASEAIDRIKEHEKKQKEIIKIENTNDFLKFLFYTMSPNEMEHYVQMYNSNGEKAPGQAKEGE